MRWENNLNSEADKWHMELEGEGEVRYSKKEGRKKRVRISVWRNLSSHTLQIRFPDLERKKKIKEK